MDAHLILACPIDIPTSAVFLFLLSLSLLLGGAIIGLCLPFRVYRERKRMRAYGRFPRGRKKLRCSKWVVTSLFIVAGVAVVWPFIFRSSITGPYSTLCWLFLPIGWFLTMLLWWIDYRPTAALPSGLCATCGYNLTGNASGICPECGTPIPDKTNLGTPAPTW
ncbi:MAG: hypothetical protein MI923_00100 [Phycisphaerales bacterium]|nr:hypothetical protein [Phycisphaerales bacterium]